MDEKPIMVEIYDTKTGVVQLRKDVGYWNEEGFVDYIWSEGNYSCDCNRKLFFERAQGNEPDDTNTPCSFDKNRYEIIVRDLEGNILYSDYSKSNKKG